MAVSVVKRPRGYVLNPDGISACIYNDYASALLIKQGHGLTTGTHVFIKSNVSTYNGFWYVQVNDIDSFFLREYATASNVEAIADTCDVTYYVAVLEHGYQCVHLPIVYKISSNLWPVNTQDTSRTISSITDDNGLCNLNLSGSLGTFDELEYVKISSNDDFSDEVYQIVDKVSTSDITINRVYEAGLSSSGTIQLYYNNYNVIVQVWGGLNTNHFWQAQKPFELLTTIKVTPDANNIASINIAEILKDQIFPTENSTLSPYLPNNLDFYTEFYIKYAESYDDAVTGEVVETISVFADDNGSTNGAAINAMLPFKNRHSGYLSNYIYADSDNLIKFLTLFNPVFFVGEYYDISFINNLATTDASTFRVKREVFIDDVSKEIFYDNIGNTGTGVYRKQIERSGWGEDEIQVTIQYQLPQNDLLFASFENLNLSVAEQSDWVISTTLAWTPSGNPGDVSRFVAYLFNFSQLQESFDITFNFVSAGGGTITFRVYEVSDVGLIAPIDSETVASSTTSGTIQLTLTVPQIGSYYIGFSATGSAGTSASISEVSYVGGPVIDISETKTITVNDDCSDQDIYLGWLNYLGGFEYWKFTARKDYVYDVDKSQITEKNIYTNWPNSYGEFANAVTKQISRESRKSIVVRSQYLTLEQLQGIKFIRFSPLVQIIEDKYNVTNVVVDAGSFREYTDQDDLYSIEFTIRFTDTIPAQFE